jgi:hypothetical protein
MIDILPKDIINLIAEYLNFKDICRLRRVNKKLSHISNKKYCIWIQLNRIVKMKEREWNDEISKINKDIIQYFDINELILFIICYSKKILAYLELNTNKHIIDKLKSYIFNEKKEEEQIIFENVDLFYFFYNLLNLYKDNKKLNRYELHTINNLEHIIMRQCRKLNLYICNQKTSFIKNIFYILNVY